MHNPVSEGYISVLVQPRTFMRLRTDADSLIKGEDDKPVTAQVHDVAWRDGLLWQVFTVTEMGNVSHHDLCCYTGQLDVRGGTLQAKSDSTGILSLENVGVLRKKAGKASIEMALQEKLKVLEIEQSHCEAKEDPHKFKLAIRIVDVNGQVVCQPIFTTIVYNSVAYGAPKIQNIFPKCGYADGGNLFINITGGGNKAGKLHAEYIMGEEEVIKERVYPEGIQTGNVCADFPGISLAAGTSRCVSVRLVTESGHASEPVDFIYANCTRRDSVRVPDHCHYEQIRELDALPSVQQYESVLHPEVPSDECGENSLFVTPQAVTEEDEDEMLDDESCKVGTDDKDKANLSSFDSFLILGEMKIKQGSIQEAVTDLKKALKRQIDSGKEDSYDVPETRRLLGKHYYLVGLYQTCDKLLKAPNFYENRKSDATHIWEYHNFIAQSYNELNNKDKEIEHYEEAIRVLSQSPAARNPPEMLAHMHNNVANAYKRRDEQNGTDKHLRLVKEHLEKAKQVMLCLKRGSSKNMIKIHLSLGNVYRIMGLIRQAIEEIELSISVSNKIYPGEKEEGCRKYAHQTLVSLYKITEITAGGSTTGQGQPGSSSAAALTDDEADLTVAAVPRTVFTSVAVAPEPDSTYTVAQDDGGVIHVEEENTFEKSPVVPSTGELNSHTGSGAGEDNPTTAADLVAAASWSTGPDDPENSAATADSSGPINDFSQTDTTPALSSPVSESAASHDPPDTPSQLNFGTGDDGTTKEPSTAMDAAGSSVTTSVLSSRVVEGSASYDPPNSPFEEEEDDSDSALSSLTLTTSDSHDDEFAAVTDDGTDLTDDTAVRQTVSTSAAVVLDSDITVTVAQDDSGLIHVEEENTLEESLVVPSTGELNHHTGNGVVEDNPTTAADSVAASCGSTDTTSVLSSPVVAGSVSDPADPPNFVATADSSGPIMDLGQPHLTSIPSRTVVESVASHRPPNSSPTQRHNQEPQPSTSAAPTHVESTQLAQASRNSDVSLGMQATQTPSLPTENSRNVSLSRIHHTQCSDGIPLGEEESPDDTLVVVIQPAEAAEVPRKRRNRSATQLLLCLLECPDHNMGIAGPSSTVSLAANRQPDAAVAVTGTLVQAETAPSGDVSPQQPTTKDPTLSSSVSPQQPTTKDPTLSSSEFSEDEVESNGHGSSAASDIAAAVSEDSDDFETEDDQMTEGEPSPPPQLTTTYNKNRFIKLDAQVCEQHVGYVLYPSELNPLTHVLEEIAGNYDKLKEVLRQSFEPIAFAVDALHESRNRSGYYHRDISADNVYLPWKYCKGEPKYGEANLMLTGNTRLVYDPCDQQTSKEAKPLAYFRFPKRRERHKKKFDWYSFGINILEVMDIAWMGNGTNSDCWRMLAQTTDVDEGLVVWFHKLHQHLKRKLDENKQHVNDPCDQQTSKETKFHYNLCRLTRKKRGHDKDDRSGEQWRKIKRIRLKDVDQEDVNHQPTDGEENDM